MIQIENVKVYGLEEVLNFRRSFNSQDKSDSIVVESGITSYAGYSFGTPIVTEVNLGPKDLAVLTKLILSGDSHSKVCRFPDVFFTLTVPRRVWVDFDTYRLGRECDLEFMSDSTMHTISKRLLGIADFSDFVEQSVIDVVNKKILQYQELISRTATGEMLENAFLEIKDNLPESFLQTRRVKTNYQTLRHIYFDRKNHRQPEFRIFCEFITGLPYSEELITVCHQK